MNKNIIIPLILSFIVTACSGQHMSEKDSIKAELLVLYDSVSNLYKKGGFESMNEVGKLITRMDANDLNGYLAQATYWEKVGNQDSAIKYYSKAAKLEPPFKIHLTLAEIYSNIGEDSLELIEINKAIYAETYMSRKIIHLLYEGKLLPTEDTIIFNIGRENLALKKRKDWYWDHQLYDSALQDMGVIVDYEPDGDNFYMKGMMEYWLKDYNKALADYEDALNVRKHYITDISSLYVYKASSLGKIGKTEQAFKLYESTLNNYGESANLFYLRGITYFDIGKKDLACKDWKKAISLGMEIDEFKTHCK